MLEMGAHLGRGPRYHRLGPPSDGVGLIGFGNPDPIRGRPCLQLQKVSPKSPDSLPHPNLPSNINHLASRAAEFWGRSCLLSGCSALGGVNRDQPLFRELIEDPAYLFHR